MTRPAGFLERLDAALRPWGWRPSSEPPLAMVPSPGTFVLPLDNGWAAVLAVHHVHEQDVELESGWRRGMREAIEVEGLAVYPPAERLIAHLEIGHGVLTYQVAPPFAVAGEHEGHRQFGGPEDHSAVVEQVVAYARDVLVPAAERDAGLDGWRADYESWMVEEPGETLAPDWELPLMLVAHGRGADALDLLTSLADDPAVAGWQATADALAAFVRSGAPLPTDDAPMAAVADARDARLDALMAEHEAWRERARQEWRHQLQKTAVELTVLGAAAALRAWRKRRG